MKGPADEPTSIHGFADYERVFGGLWNESRMSFAVSQYFQNGGCEAVIVRVAPEATPSTWSLKCAGKEKDLKLEASSPGAWGKKLAVEVNDETSEKADGDPPGEPELFNLIVTDTATGGGSETLRNLSVKQDSPRFVGSVLAQGSRFLRLAKGSELPGKPPLNTEEAAANKNDPPKKLRVMGADGGDGTALKDTDLVPAQGQQGVRALATAEAFSLLCLPPPSETADVGAATYSAAVTFLKSQGRRAMVIVDPPAVAKDVDGAKKFQTELNLADDHAALFFPRLLAPNPKKENLVEEFAPCGAVAGVFARTDAQRGVWKAPAGAEARIAGVSGLTCTLTDAENGALNPLGINCIRNLPQAGTVIWGSRTLRGADALADQWKYVPVRRVAFFIEDSLQRGLGWVVFEPNDEPLWSQVRLNVGSFMNGLFRQGAFQGTTPAQAYFVKCDSETTTQDDVDRGIVNIVVGFAPLKPAEFVVLKIQQIAAQSAA